MRFAILSPIYPYVAVSPNSRDAYTELVKEGQK